MGHRGRTVLAMDCALAGAERQLGRPLNEIVRRHMKLRGTFITVLATSAIVVEAAGTVVHGRLESQALGVSKSYAVYLPEGYGRDSQRFPVIYLLHGWGVTETAWLSGSLDLPGTADGMHLKTIVVMPDGDRSFYANSVTATDYEACLAGVPPIRNRSESREDFCVRFPRYEDYIWRDVVAHVDKTYRTVPNRAGRALVGESGGGLGAMHLAIRHRDVFSAAASHSAPLALLYDGPRPYDGSKVRLRTNFQSYPPGLAEPIAIFGTDSERWRSYDPSSLVDTLRNGDLAIYFDCGEEDEPGFHDHALFFDARLRERGIEHTFVSVRGNHSDSLWKERIKVSLQFLVDHFKKLGTYPRGGT